MKKVSALLLSAASAAVLCGSGSQTYTLGDADGNSVVDGRDASLILTEYARTSVGKSGTFTDIQNKAADVDENKIVDGRDASWILSYYAYISVNGGDMDLRRFVKGETAEAPTQPPVQQPVCNIKITDGFTEINTGVFYPAHSNGNCSIPDFINNNCGGIKYNPYTNGNTFSYEEGEGYWVAYCFCNNGTGVEWGYSPETGFYVEINPEWMVG